MKKIYLALFVCFLATAGFAQENEYEKTNNDPVHEVKANVGLLFLGNINLTYENILNEESAIGGSISFPYDDFIDWDLNFSATAYYRFYFGEGYAKGVFAEGFGMFNNYRENTKVTNSGRVEEDLSDFALGLGGGYKLVSDGGVTLEFHLGIGRNLFNYDLDGRDFTFVPRGGIHVGYRF